MAGVAKLLESVLNQVLQAQVTEQVAAERYERTDERQGYPNGSYPHQPYHPCRHAHITRTAYTI
jgi:transposase-like protein